MNCEYKVATKWNKNQRTPYSCIYKCKRCNIYSLHLLVQSQQQKHQNNLFWCLYCWLWTSKYQLGIQWKNIQAIMSIFFKWVFWNDKNIMIWRSFHNFKLVNVTSIPNETETTRHHIVRPLLWNWTNIEA